MSSTLWPNATKDNPCKVCGKPDWCSFGDKAMKCQRVQSNNPCSHGGWLHFYDKIGPRPSCIPPARKSSPPLKNAAGVMKSFYNDPLAVESLASALGVSAESLNALEVKWSVEHNAFAAPMRDGDNNVIGIHLRGKDYKKAVVGSRNGLFLAQCEHDKMAFVCEGMSNSAAFLTMDLFPIGRPSCNTGGEMVLIALKRLGIRKVCIVGDNDDQKCQGKRPGYEGAEKLRKELRGISTVTWVPPSPCKGIRDLLLRIGAESAKGIILSSIHQKIWH